MMQTSEDEIVRVLFIAGQGRSGSTLLERILAQADSFVGVGELHHLWTWLEMEGMCSCGLSTRDCKFWGQVVEETLGGFDDRLIKTMATRTRSMFSVKSMPLTLYKQRPGSACWPNSEYMKITERLYTSVKRLSGKSFIIDSTKHPIAALLVNCLSKTRLHLLHLVRDSRAVSYSWIRRKPTPERNVKDGRMETYSPPYSAAAWVYRNLLTDWAAMQTQSYLRVRYGDLAQQPERMVARVLSWLGMEGSAHGLIEGGTALLPTCHTIAGNPLRFETGPVEIREDLEWKSSMGSLDKFLVTLITGPLLMKYDYELSWHE